MACKKTFMAILIMVLPLTTALFAQSFDNDACYVVETDEGREYIQRFEWQQINYIQKFEFHLEQQDEKTGSWNETECIETVDSAVELSIPAGNYRYKIVVFNLLGQAELESDWIPFEIIKVYTPEVTGVSPSTIYLEEPQTGNFTISGRGLLGSSSITFWNEEGLLLEVENLGSDEKNREITFHVDPALLETGKYTVGIKNEGGLDTTWSPVTVKFKKAFDLDVSFGYTCLLNLFDSSFEEFFGKRVLPLSGTLKISAIPFKRNFGNFGIGLTGTYSMLNDLEMEEVTTGYQITGNMIGGYASFIYQYAFHRESDNKIMFVLEAHGGAGLVLIHDVTFHFPNNISTEPFSVMYLSALGGGSAQLYLTNRLYLECNIDFTFTPSVDLTMGNLIPSIMVGWQF